MFQYLLPLIASFCLLVHAQTTVTTTNAAGLSIVQVIQTNTLGSPTATQILQTITPTTTSPTTTTPTTTTPDVIGKGPVGAPAATSGTPGAPTPYTYTTVIGGVTTAVAAIFTPTSPATTPVNVPASGTILDYSAWLSINSINPTAVNGAANCIPRATYLLMFVLAIIVGSL